VPAGLLPVHVPNQADDLHPVAAMNCEDICLEEPKIKSLKVQDSKSISPTNCLPRKGFGAVKVYSL